MDSLFNMEMLLTYGPLAFMMVLFYFMLYRPQKKAQSKRKEMLNQMKVGDRIMTIGGMYGEVAAISEETVRLKIADGVEVKFNRAAINMNLSRKEETKGAQS